MNLTEALINDREKELLYESPGAVTLQNTRRMQAEEDAKANEIRTAKALEKSNILQIGPTMADYDYQAAVAEGNSLQPKAEGESTKLAVKHFRPYSKIIAGYDQTTGEKIYNDWEDIDGQISAGVSELRESVIDLDRGRPGTDAPALAKIANAIIVQDGNYVDFQNAAKDGWQDETLKAAWNANWRANFRQEAQAQFEHASDMFEAEGEMPIEETEWEIPENIDPESLPYNQDFLQAQAVMYEWFEQRPFEGTKEELTKWGLTQMGLFNWNTAYMALFTTRAVTASNDAQRWSIYKSMQYYDALNRSQGGLGRALFGIATDPTTYLTFGFGKLGTQAAAIAAKNAVAKALMSGLKGKVIGAAASTGAAMAGWTALDDFMRQTIEQKAGVKDQYDLGELSIAAGLGFGVGNILGGVGAGVASKEFMQMAKRLKGKSREFWQKTVDRMLEQSAASESLMPLNM